MEQLVNFHTQNGVLEIQFNRADKKNALTNAMYQAVQSAMEQAKSDDNIQETFARNSPFARSIPPNRKKTMNGNEISKTMAKSWIKSPNDC